MTPERCTLDRVDVALPGGRVLRLELHHDAMVGLLRTMVGLPTTLGQICTKVLLVRFCCRELDPARLDPGGLILPAETLPDLRAALTALDTLNGDPER